MGTLGGFPNPPAMGSAGQSPTSPTRSTRAQGRFDVVVVVVIVGGVVESRTVALGQLGAEQRARSAVAKEFEKRERRRKLRRRNFVEELACLPPQDLARRLAGRDGACHLYQLGRLRHVSP